MWTARQRLGLGVLALGVAAVGAVRWAMNPRYVADPQPVGAENELVERVDPNEADAATLAALPGIGMSVAGRIVEYREKHAAEKGGGRAFKRLEDLKEVKGIGDATIQTMAPYLEFEE
jgi:competence ComEA-like helix-hairpin-helix protein